MAGPIAYKDFVAPPPGPAASEGDHSSAVKALATFYGSLSSSVPLSGWSPSPAPEAAAPVASLPDADTAQHASSSGGAALAPTDTPSNAPRPLNPTAGSSILTATPGLLPDEASLSSGLAQLQSVYPALGEDFLLAALERHEYDPAAALGWLVSVTDINIMASTMTDAFPSAPKRIVNRLVQECGGDLSAVWSTLSRSYASAWTDRFSASAIQRKSSRSRILVNDEESDASEVMVVSDELRRFESSWWASVHSARRFRLGTASPHLSSWDSICSIACTNTPVPPRFSGHIFSLGLRSKDTSAFKEAVTVLRSLPTYKAICKSLAKLHPAATAVVQILVEDGLSNPSAALWLALNSSAPDSIFTGFTRAHISVCKKRNKALHAAKLAPHPSAARSAQVINDSDIESELDMGIIPARDAGSPIDWESEVAPNKVNLSGKKPKAKAGARKGGRSSTKKTANRASDRISNLSNVSAGTLDFFLKPVAGDTTAGPSRSRNKSVSRTRAGKLKAVPTEATTPFRDS